MHFQMNLLFQLRKLKERSKTEVVDPRRTVGDQRSRQRNERKRRILVEKDTFKNNLGARDQEKIFQEMVGVVGGCAAGREDSPDSDCEKYFSDD